MHPIDKLANVIRRYPNNAPTRTLATAIAIHLTPGEPDCGGCRDLIAALIDRVNPDRTMGAGVLAQTIWNDALQEIAKGKRGEAGPRASTSGREPA